MVIPLKNLLAMNTDTLKKKSCTEPRNPKGSMGTLLISRTMFTIAYLERRVIGIKPKIDKSGSVIMISGFEIIIYNGRKNNIKRVYIMDEIIGMNLMGIEIIRNFEYLF